MFEIEAHKAIEKGATIEILGIDEDSIEKIRSIHADVLFNIIEWDGFDTPLSVRALGLIESLHIPYTGPAVEAIEVCSTRFPHSDIPGSKVATHLPETYRSYATSFFAV